MSYKIDVTPQCNIYSYSNLFKQEFLNLDLVILKLCCCNARLYGITDNLGMCSEVNANEFGDCLWVGNNTLVSLSSYFNLVVLLLLLMLAD